MARIQTTLFEHDRFSGVTRSAAELSPDGRYRWWLRRSWNQGTGTVCFVMLNPSTADALVDDPTIRRCIGFAKAWGYATLSVRNLFCLRATDPREIRRYGVDADGGPRGTTELHVAKTADMLVAAWGASVPFERDVQALDIFEGKPVYCLGKTKNGHPRHPLYVRADQEPVLYRFQVSRTGEHVAHRTD